MSDQATAEENGAKSRRGGRPRLQGEVVQLRLTLTLHVGADDDLLKWFGAVPAGKRASRVKAALRQGGAALGEEAAIDPDQLIDDEAFAALLDAL